MDELPGGSSPYLRGNPIEDMTPYLKKEYEEDTIDEVNAAVQALRLQVTSIIIQELADMPDMSERLAYLKPIAMGNTQWESKLLLIADFMWDFNGLPADRREEIAGLLDAVIDEALLLYYQFLTSDQATESQAKSRYVASLRYAGLTDKSWEDLSTEYHVSEKSIRKALNHYNLPTSHI